MGRNLTNHSESLVRDQGGSPCRRSPSRRERSTVRHRSLHEGSYPAREEEKHSRRAKFPKHTRSQSPVSRSPSPHRRRLMRARDEREVEKVKDREDEKNPGRRSDRGMDREKSRSPVPRSPSPRSKRLARARNERDAEKVTEREHERNNGRGSDKKKNRERSGPPISRSPSPRTKWLRRAESEKEVVKLTEREHEMNHGRASDKGTHRERGSDRETGSERKERRDRDMKGVRKERNLGRDETNNKSSRARHDQSSSPLDPPHRSRHRSLSPQSVDGGRARHEGTISRGAEDRTGGDSVAKMKATEEVLQAKEKQQPSFELSGKLAAETNRFRGVTLLFNEPPDARKPDVRWRLYVFKSGEVLKEPLYIHRQSCYLFGRERRVADIPTDHPSCSKQHAVIQFRQVEKEQPDGMLSKQVRPYLMDLGSTNKTYLNENPIEPQRYYELFEKDTIKFGNSSREYVLLHENSVS